MFSNCFLPRSLRNSSCRIHLNPGGIARCKCLSMTSSRHLFSTIWKSSLPEPSFFRLSSKMTLPRSVLLPPRGSAKPLSSRQEVAQVYKLRWSIETFFGWWKRHLKVYHLIARSQYGLMVQLLGGLITYLLLAIYCREQHNEPVSIARVRELRNQIANEATEELKKRQARKQSRSNKIRKLKPKRRRAKT